MEAIRRAIWKSERCASCGEADHRRRTSKLCRMSYCRERRRTIFFLKEELKSFEDFISEYDITMKKLAPASCSNWIDIPQWGGNRHKWKLEYLLQKKLCSLHYTAAKRACDYERKFKGKLIDQKNEISDILSENGKKFFGIVGSNAPFEDGHYGTVILLKVWNISVETEKTAYVKCENGLYAHPKLVRRINRGINRIPPLLNQSKQ